jgi:FMN phosphatase YigB (HAD superfamily)
VWLSHCKQIYSLPMRSFKYYFSFSFAPPEVLYTYRTRLHSVSIRHREASIAMFSKLLCLLRGEAKSIKFSHDTSPSQPEFTQGKTGVDTTATPLDAADPQEGFQPKTRILILDLGDVLFHYAVRRITALSPSVFKTVITSPGWQDFECGRVTEDEALASITNELSLDLNTIRQALSQCRQLLHVDHDLYEQLRALKAEMNGSLKVYAMTNISRDDFVRLKIILPSWELFDAEFTSFEAGMIKPDLGYYQHVLNSIGLSETGSTIFVDDKVVNVEAAKSFGIHGIVFESPRALMDQLRSELLPRTPN